MLERGSNNTKIAIEMSKYAEEVGVNGLLIVTPYYNKCSQEGLYESYYEIAKNVSIPIILYNVPSRTGVNIEPETVLKLSKIKNIIGIKEASSNISQIAKILDLVDDDFYVYSGNDDQTLPILALGGKGVISVAANIIPNKIHEMCNLFFEGNLNSAKTIFFDYLELMNNMFIDVNPIPIKEAMNLLGFDVGSFRLPLNNTTAEKKEIISNSIKKLKEA